MGIWYITRAELKQLETFNAERARGLVHFPEWIEKMENLQEQYDRSLQEQNERSRKVAIPSVRSV